MIRLLLILMLLCFAPKGFSQTYTMSLGVFTGMTSTFSFNQGIDADPRFKERYDIKWAPLGLNYSLDFDGYGMSLGAELINTGQNHYVINTSGGQVGIRRCNLQYITIPLLFKVHLIDLSFFNVSVVGGAGLSYLVSGKETLTMQAAKLKFPPEVYPILPPTYDSVYDGVLVPEINNLELLGKKDFKSFQLFGIAGLHSDWNLSDELRITFDFLVNYGFFDPRSDRYIEQVNDYQTLYDLPGKRRDLFVQINVGIARFLEVEKKDKVKTKQHKGSSKKYEPKKYPWPKPRKSKPTE